MKFLLLSCHTIELNELELPLDIHELILKKESWIIHYFLVDEQYKKPSVDFQRPQYSFGTKGEECCWDMKPFFLLIFIEKPNVGTKKRFIQI